MAKFSGTSIKFYEVRTVYIVKITRAKILAQNVNSGNEILIANFAQVMASP